MIREVFMPALSSTMTEGKIVSWVKSPGDKVEKGETVVIVESDKADMDVESFYEGYLAAIVVEAGELASVGNAIALLAETEAELEEAKAKASTLEVTGSTASPPPATPASSAAAPESTPATPSATQNGSAARSGRTIVSPRARKLAKELKVDLATVQGSGPHGRIVAQDVELAAGKAPTLSPTPSVTAPAAKPISPALAAEPATVPAPAVCP
ncbi:MAG: hypothetical protein F6K42_36830 [Leptolyngbya sp. SIO1D8]|nr:hypothetical protein [Leptolyngbya sp. SIO1D8]